MLALIGEGMTNRGIAQAMFLAEKTVKNYVSSMLAKLDLQCRTQAAVFAARHLPNLPQRASRDTTPGPRRVPKVTGNPAVRSVVFSPNETSASTASSREPPRLRHQDLHCGVDAVCIFLIDQVLHTISR